MAFDENRLLANNFLDDDITVTLLGGHTREEFYHVLSLMVQHNVPLFSVFVYDTQSILVGGSQLYENGSVLPVFTTRDAAEAFLRAQDITESHETRVIYFAELTGFCANADYGLSFNPDYRRKLEISSEDIRRIRADAEKEGIAGREGAHAFAEKYCKFSDTPIPRPDLRKERMQREMDAAFNCIRNNEALVIAKRICGCFKCIRLFRAGQVEHMLQDSSGESYTLLCPFCGEASVVPYNPKAYFLGKALLQQMKDSGRDQPPTDEERRRIIPRRVTREA